MALSSVNDKETAVHVTLAVFSCFLSIFGSLLIIVTYCAYAQIRKPARTLLLWLSISDLGTALIYLFTFAKCGDKCECSSAWKDFCALFGIWFPVASFLWTDCIGLYIYAATYQKTWMAPRERLFTIFHIISWGLPTIVCITIIIINAAWTHQIQIGSGVTGGWCWIQQWRYDLLGGKVIETVSYVFLLVIYWWTWKELKRINAAEGIKRILHHRIHSPNIATTSSYTGNNESHQQQQQQSTNPMMSGSVHSGGGHGGAAQDIHGSMSHQSHQESIRSHLKKQNKSEAVNRLLFIPVVFFFLRIWGTAHMIVSNILTDKQYEILKIMENILALGQAICDPLQGFCNGILFVVFVSEVRHQLFVSLSTYIKYRYLSLCGAICCCGYCFACCCNACNECFDCCLSTKYNDNTNYYHHQKHGMRYNQYTPPHQQQQSQKYNYANYNDPNGMTNYCEPKYQFLPKPNDNVSSPLRLNTNEEANETNKISVGPTAASPSITDPTADDTEQV